MYGGGWPNRSLKGQNWTGRMRGANRVLSRYTLEQCRKKGIKGMVEVVKRAEILANFTWIINVKLRCTESAPASLSCRDVCKQMSFSVRLQRHPKQLINRVKSERFCSNCNCNRSAQRDWTQASETARLGFSEALQTYTSRWWKSELQALGIAPRAFHFLSCHKLSCKDVLSKRTFWFCNASYLRLMQQYVADRAGKTKRIL